MVSSYHHILMPHHFTSLYLIELAKLGPSGFYTAKYLTELDPSLKVDIIERFPTPFGLVRFGVAPDHELTKNVMSTFHEVAAKRNQVTYRGNLQLGKDVTLQQLQEVYSAVVIATGASSDRKLGLKHDTNPYVIPARHFVNWYNGHPDFTKYMEHKEDSNSNLSNITDVVIIGNGNVALDCARILLKSTDQLNTTDIVPSCLTTLARANIKNVHIVGRRSHVQASFTIKELRELSKLPSVKAILSQDDIDRGTNIANNEEINSSRARKRITELMQSFHSEPSSGEKDEKNVHFRFLSAPKEIKVTDDGKLDSLVVERTTLSGEAHKQILKTTGELETIPCQMILLSIGYSVEPIENLPLNSTKTFVENMEGRVVGKPGVYVTGWLKRGPSGIIGTNIPDAKETATAVLNDKDKLKVADSEMIESLFKKIEQDRDTVNWDEYIQIEQEEINRGSMRDPPTPREKILEVDEQISVVRRQQHP